MLYKRGDEESKKERCRVTVKMSERRRGEEEGEVERGEREKERNGNQGPSK